MNAASGIIRTMTASPRVHLCNPKENAAEITALLSIADELGAQLCVFPELCLTGCSCGDLFYQPALLRAALDALSALALRETKAAFVVSLPMEISGRLYSCAAVVSGGRVVIVPKMHIPDDGGACGRAYFTPGQQMQGSVCIPNVPADRVCLAESPVIDLGLFSLGVEIGEEFRDCYPSIPAPAMRGALIVANPSACSAVAGGHAALSQSLSAYSARCLCAYAHAGAGYGESTTDAVFSGYAGVYECGELLAENERFSRESSYAIADVDIERLAFKRRASASFAAAPSSAIAPILPAPQESEKYFLLRPLSRLPFLPKHCEEKAFLDDALHIQALGLIRRMEQVRTRKLVLGVSGGLDSTLALLSAAYAYDLAGWDRQGIIGITMPGFGTGTRTKGNAEKLMELIGCTTLTIPIGPAVMQHFADIGQSADVHDICYENSQARERTQIIMDYANKIGALVLGTGDLSELALGWCTYNGDHMSMYNLNGTVPKTLMRSMVAYAARQLGEKVVPVAQDILDTPVSPELLPGKNGEIAQKTEETLGAYELHDFFLWHMMDAGAGPQKLFVMACQTFEGEHSREAVLSALRIFIRRFFTQQFKRSAMPDGPQVTPVSLSPRGAWHMPSDAQMALWSEEAEDISL